MYIHRSLTPAKYLPPSISLPCFPTTFPTTSPLFTILTPSLLRILTPSPSHALPNIYYAPLRQLERRTKTAPARSDHHHFLLLLASSHSHRTNSTAAGGGDLF